MGGGKTLFATLWAIQYRQKYPNNEIYANYSLKNLKGFTYTPNFFLPFSKLKNCLLILDDISAIENQGYQSIIVNASRKSNIDIILTGQYYSQCPPKIRELSEILNVRYFKDKDLLRILNETKRDNNLPNYLIWVQNAVKKGGTYYDTTEIVHFPTESEFIAQIAQVSETAEDIELNVQLFTKNKTERRRLMKLVSAVFEETKLKPSPSKNPKNKK